VGVFEALNERNQEILGTRAVVLKHNHHKFSDWSVLGPILAKTHHQSLCDLQNEATS
jgi:hypothetical protein